MAESPQLAAAKRLLDHAKDRGFAFQRIAPGPPKDTEPGRARRRSQRPRVFNEILDSYLQRIDFHGDQLRDPFDRLILATAAQLGVPLVTADRAISKAGTVEIVW